MRSRLHVGLLTGLACGGRGGCQAFAGRPPFRLVLLSLECFRNVGVAHRFLAVRRRRLRCVQRHYGPEADDLHERGSVQRRAADVL